MKEETKEILTILTSMREDMIAMKKTMATKDDIKNMATKDDIKNMATKSDMRDIETRLSAEIYTATRAMRDDIIALYDEDIELDNKIFSNKIDFKSLYSNILERVKRLEKHTSLAPSNG